MWFKTRVSLVSIHKPTEILPTLYAVEEGGFRYAIAAYVKALQEVKVTNPSGSENQFKNPVTHLAFFMDNADTPRIIGECMALIEKAIRDNETLCDLSQIGSQEAWKSTWHQIQWPPAPELGDSE